MQRLPLLGVLVVAAIVATSAWFVIDARSDPEPLPVAEHLPRDDEQSQQEGSQDQPEPGPEEESDQEPADDESDGVATRESREDEVAESTEQPQLAPEPVDVLIAALDVPRPPIELVPMPAMTGVFELETYVVEAGDTLADIAEAVGLELHDLIAANELDSPDQLYVGQELAVPVEVVATEPPEEAEPPFEPAEVAPAITGDGIVYGTIRDYERGVVNSAVVAKSLSDASIWLVEACVDGERRTYIMGLPSTDGLTRIYWRFDEGPLSTDRWTAGDGLIESHSRTPLLRTLEDQTEVRTLWIRVGGHDLTFGVQNLIPDEVHANFSHCGS